MLWYKHKYCGIIIVTIAKEELIVIKGLSLSKNDHKLPQGPKLGKIIVFLSLTNVAFVTVVPNLFSLILGKALCPTKTLHCDWCSVLLKVKCASITDFNIEWKWPNSLWSRLLARWVAKHPVDGHSLKKINHFIFHIMPYKLFIWAGSIAKPVVTKYAMN